MESFDIFFEQFRYSDQADKSIKNFANWIFGISIGFSTILIFQMKDFELSKYCFSKEIYLILIFFSMLNLLFSSYLKYLIHNRDVNMSIKYGSLKKLVSITKLKTFNTIISENIKDDFKKKLDVLLGEWFVEVGKIKKIGTLLEISIFTTATLVITTGVYIMTIV